MTPERFLERIREGFLRNVLILLSGTAISQILPMVASVFIARMFTPEEFGLLGLFISVLSVASVVICMRYEHALLIQKDDAESLNIAHTCLLLSLTISLIFIPIVAIFRSYLADAMNSPELAIALWLLPVALLFTGCAQVWTLWLLRHQRVELIAKSRIIQAIVLTGLSIGFGFLDTSGIWLIIASIAGQTAALTWLWIRTGNSLPRFAALPIHTIRGILNRLRHFPFYTVPADLLSTGTMQLPMFFLGMNYGLAFTGVFLLSQRVLSVPLNVIGSAVMDAYKRDSSNIYAETGNCYSLAVKTIKYLSMISIIPFLIVILWSPDIFEIIFGVKWIYSGVICQILAIPLFLRFISTPITYIFYISKNQKEDFFIQIYSFISNVCIFLVSIYKEYSFQFVISIYSANMTAVYLYYLLRSIILSKGTKGFS